MASFFRSVRQGFNRQPEVSTSSNSSQNRVNGVHDSSPTIASPTMAGLSPSQSFGSSTGLQSDNPAPPPDAHPPAEQPKYFFREKYAKLGVKGNFMPLAAQPINIGLADWLAHQTVENYRLVSSIVACIQETDQGTGKPICNPESCPKMTAGRHSYIWLDNNRRPVAVSASQYISLVQRWLNAKVHDPKAFPTDAPGTTSATYASGSVTTPASETPIAAGPTNLNAPLSQLAGKDWIGRDAGFPESFYNDCRTCFRQMFRIYAHIYHSHWIDPFWNLSSSSTSQGWTDLNSCFVHFCTVAKLYGLLTEKDVEPMQPLIDLWIANGSIPPAAANEESKIRPPQ